MSWVYVHSFMSEFSCVLPFPSWKPPSENPSTVKSLCASSRHFYHVSNYPRSLSISSM